MSVWRPIPGKIPVLRQNGDGPESIEIPAQPHQAALTALRSLIRLKWCRGLDEALRDADETVAFERFLLMVNPFGEGHSTCELVPVILPYLECHSLHEKVCTLTNLPSYKLSDAFNECESHQRAEAARRRERGDRDWTPVAMNDFSRIPEEILRSHFVSYLCAKDLLGLRATCRWMDRLFSDHVPGLKSTLYPHQFEALSWMEARESLNGTREHPDVHKAEKSYTYDVLKTDQNETVGVNVVTGFVRPFPNGCAVDEAGLPVLGGLFCDAPGLGKTATVLSLILRTRGVQSRLNGGRRAVSTEAPTKTKRFSPMRSALTQRTLRLASLPSSACTLVVAPRTLISHWKEQILLHTQWGALSYMVVDEVSDPSPSLNDLTNSLDLLLMSTQRVSREAQLPDEESALTAVRFLRVVCDEGHSLGGDLTNYAEMLSKRVQTDRRWVMTGTPAKMKGDESASLASMANLFTFLRLEPWCTSSGAFSSSFTRYFKSQDHPAAYLRLENVLQNLMMRHTKDSIQGVAFPRLVTNDVVLTPSAMEMRRYDVLVNFVRMNVVLTSIGTKGMEDSLLNQANAKQAGQVVRNVRILCSGLDEDLLLTLSPQNVLETRQLMLHRSEEAKVFAEEFMRRAVSNEDLQCAQCAFGNPLQLLTPCGHCWCVECLDQALASRPAGNAVPCPACGVVLDLDELSYLQPGFDLTWGIVSTGFRRPSSIPPALHAHLPLDRVRSTKADFILGELRASPRSAANVIVFSQFRTPLDVIGDLLIRALGKDAVCEFWGRYRDDELTKWHTRTVREWVCGLCGYVNADVHAATCRRRLYDVSVFSAQQEGTAPPPVVVVRDLRLEHFERSIPGEDDSYDGPSHLSVGTDRRFRRADADPAAGFPETGRVLRVAHCAGKVTRGRWRTRAFPATQTQVLLLGKDGYQGLDLSRANRIFCLEVISDDSIMEQVVSRAWRLGNNFDVVRVDTLVLKGTLDEDYLVKKRSGNRIDEDLTRWALQTMRPVGRSRPTV